MGSGVTMLTEEEKQCVMWAVGWFCSRQDDPYMPSEPPRFETYRYMELCGGDDGSFSVFADWEGHKVWLEVEELGDEAILLCDYRHYLWDMCFVVASSTPSDWMKLVSDEYPELFE